MRLLADENIPSLVVDLLRARGHDATWVGKEAPGISDPEVLSLAATEKRTLVTFDTDFGELVFRLRLNAPFGVILLRLLPNSPSNIAETIIKALETQSDWTNLFSVVDEKHIRTRSLPKS